MGKPPTHVLFSSDLWEPALEKYAEATHVTVKLFDTDLRVVFGPLHPTPLFELFDRGGYDPGLFAECARQCLAQTTERPAVTVSKVHGLAVVGTSLVLGGKIVGAAVAGYVLLDFSQLSEIQRIAKDARLDFAKIWQVARQQSPVSHQRLNVNGELLQVLGDALLRENSRTRQYEHTATEVQEAARAAEGTHQKVLQTASVLRESEQRYRTLFDLGPIAVYSCDASGVIRDFNRVAAELWGREPRPGDTDGVFMPHEQCPMAEVLSGKVPEVRDAEVQIERPDGSRITVLVNIRPLKNERGEITGAINCFVDITGRKQTEAAVRESEERFRTLFDSAPMAIFVCDEKAVIQHYNRRAAELWGREPQCGVEKHCGSVGLWLPNGTPLPHDQSPVLDVLRTGVPVLNVEVFIERPDGSRLPVLANFAPMKGAKGEITGAITSFVDISERKQAEEARGRLAAIVEFSDDAIISKTLDGTITSWNKGAEHLFGYTAEEAIGQNITLVIPPDRLSEEATILQRLRREESIEHFDTLRMRKDGTMIDISLTISPVKDAAGHIIGASKVARDITERKRAERALQEAHDQLESLVALRTAAVRKLSSQMIRSQDEERRRISRELHDSVGQRLALAKMSLAGLKKPGISEEETKALGHVADSLDECLAETRTISYLLHPPLLDEVGFPSAASWYVEGFSQRSGIQVNFDIPRALARLPGDLELVLFRILQESLTNVHRHAQTQSVDVRLQAGDSEVALDVRDHGKGMPPELLARFRTNGGGGVGLNSMRERISELGGKFEIQSDTRGTHIRVVIPIPATVPQIAKAKGT
jgi:PAS domain S-box-containing protein